MSRVPILFSNLPNEILEIICSSLNVKEERNLGLVFQNVEHLRKKNMMTQLTKVLNSSEAAMFHHLLRCIIENEKTGLAILQNEHCKNILITQKPKSLPHWILSIGECQPHLLEFIMEDEDYRNSLTKVETGYLITNYEKLLSPGLSAKINEELTHKKDFHFEEVLFDEDEEKEINPLGPLP
ncbi:hypothetical protein OQJ19_15945 [Fluoribacter gormanii]|uniref:hypothetical protein n=1 Tax=Fluoribacter gormanii TaxID=464 RepID=UPI002242E102|nr:hypothetical protein [Fluoribacter gormanii]MCW8472125.1 hypothetical protein [Fluoribacter gormanii]